MWVMGYYTHCWSWTQDERCGAPLSVSKDEKDEYYYYY